MDGTGVIAVHPQLQLFEAVGTGLVNGQLHQITAQTAAPVIFPYGDAYYGTMAVLFLDSSSIRRTGILAAPIGMHNGSANLRIPQACIFQCFTA